MRFILGIFVAGLLIAGGSDGITSAGAAEFYKGKTLKVIIRSKPGGGYDFYGRLLVRHMPRHIPGNPDAIAVNMPGAGGIVAANYLMNRAKRDGTEIGVLTRELALAQRTGATGVRYDVRKMVPLGSMASETFLVLLAKNHPVKSVLQLRKFKQTVLLAATGPGSGSYQWASLLKFDGFPVKVISGYSGGQERFLAIERGDVQGTANSYESSQVAMKEHGFVPILYAGAKVPALKGVPNITEALSPKGDELAALMGAPLSAGRPIFTTPDVPADRVAILRAALKATLADPRLIKEAERAKRSVDWTDPVEMDAINRKILKASDEVVALYNEGSGEPKARLIQHEGKVSKIKRGGRQVWIMHDGKEVGAKISGSRTKITVAGNEAKRKAIKVGMNCRFTYPKPGAEATKVDCK